MGNNPILMGKAVEVTPRYYFMTGEGSKGYFSSSEDFLQFLRDNDPVEAGCDLMTDEEFGKLEPLD